MTTLSNCFRTFVQDRCRNNDTQEEQDSKLKRWLLILGDQEVTVFFSARRPDILRLLREHSPNLSNSTVNRYLTVLQSALNSSPEMVDRKVDLGRLKEPDPKEETLTDDELDSIQEHMLIRMRGISNLLVGFLRRTGCRVGEALALTSDDVSWSEGGAVVTVVVRRSKAGRPRTLFLPPLAAIPLGTSGRVFPTSYGRFLRHWKDAVLELGRPGVTPHALRHTWATNAARDGVPLPTIARALGHRSVSTTQRYLHVDDGDVRRAMLRSVAT